MCESKIVVRLDGEEKVLADEIAALDPAAMKAYRVDGSTVDLAGYRIEMIDFLRHRVYVKPVEKEA
ncbi:MAG: hypothetical protein GXO09_03900 [Crenarchaeota archaeon]|nr:hypothetical protein [Thermoproteota archaeon]